MVPKREVDYIFDLTDEEYADLQLFAKKVAAALREAVPCKRIGMAVMGLEVPHAHIHLIPINAESDMNFFAPKKQIAPQEMELLAKRISDAFKGLKS